MQTTELIEEQISSCRELLDVFKGERETYGDSDDVNLKLVMATLKRKQGILNSFNQQKEIMQAIQQHGHQDETIEKNLLRELGGILEQLLVIDQENEVLLRNLLQKKPAVRAVKTTPQTSLSPDLPFCPDSKTSKVQAPVKILTATEITGKADMLQDKLNLFSRKKLKAYGA